MKRKVLQDFANVCCQMFLTSMTNYDRINFVMFGSGPVEMDFLNQRCRHNGIAVSLLHYCFDYREWFLSRCKEHHVDVKAITTAELTVKMEVETHRKKGGTPGSLTTSMKIDCSSLIVMDAQEYRSVMRDEQTSGLGQIIRGHTY